MFKEIKDPANMAELQRFRSRLIEALSFLEYLWSPGTSPGGETVMIKNQLAKVDKAISELENKNNSKEKAQC